MSGMVADNAGSILVPPRVLASVGARVDVTRELRLALDLRNLFDVRTSTYEGALGPTHEPIGDYFEYPLPGRTFLRERALRSRRGSMSRSQVRAVYFSCTALLACGGPASPPAPSACPGSNAAWGRE